MVGVYGLDGEKVSDAALPSVFETGVRRDLIKRAVISLQTHRLQAYGPSWMAGKDTSAFSYGPGRGLARLPRVTGGGPARGRGAIVPYAVGGRRAHPPVPERVLSKKLNKKERLLATASAVAATADKEIVESRGHRVDGVSEFPVVVVDGFESLNKTKDVSLALAKLGCSSDLERAKSKSIRSGKGTKRGRKYKRKKSVLIVVSSDASLSKAAGNISGVDVTSVKNLNAAHLAPGANPARLTVYTESALKELEMRFSEAI
ncbi:MAG TPA: 50S ribosomal protein L4 [Euryarchaeota archaeon]|nr:50S ribosomal protein L4P [archaeon BMS3Bbin16]HDH27620.1 50S ribosomal protein L4 [Euryarchaeota archaeon]